MTVEGFTPKGDDDDESRFNEVGPDYFRTLGIPLVAGREFTDADRAGAPKVADRQRGVRAALHRRTAPAIGTRVMRGGAIRRSSSTPTIVGVVKDANYSNMREPMPPVYYSVAAQSPPAAQHELLRPHGE